MFKNVRNVIVISYPIYYLIIYTKIRKAVECKYIKSGRIVELYNFI